MKTAVTVLITACVTYTGVRVYRWGAKFMSTWAADSSQVYGTVVPIDVMKRRERWS